MIETSGTEIPSPGEFTRNMLRNNPEYSATLVLDELRKKEYARLDATGSVYLDYTGGNLYSEKQIKRHAENLLGQVLGNPHSHNPSSEKSSRLVETTRKRILDFFNANDKYFLIFTPNASGALKIIGESYPFAPGGHFLLPFDNHNSVNGIREYARAKGADVIYSPLIIEDLTFDGNSLLDHLTTLQGGENKLFAFPAQSNVSGVKHSLDWVETARTNGWDVLLDASAFVPTSTLDLDLVKPDFVSMSFYKMFGYPTGLGGLFVRKDKFNKLLKPWFAGGTVTLASAMTENFMLAADHAKFEDGTINYLDIPALQYGFDLLEEIGMDIINLRVALLTNYLIDSMRNLKHTNGQPLIRVFGPAGMTNRGGTIIFNFLSPEGETRAYLNIESEASKRNISIRTGCFCNPGIDELNNHLEAGELDAYFKSTQNGSVEDMMERLHTLRGAIRVSVGMVTNLADLYAFLHFVASYSM